MRGQWGERPPFVCQRMETQRGFITGDKRFLLLPAPALQLLLALDGLPYVMEPLDQYKFDRPSSMGEAPRIEPFLMLGESAIDIIGDPDVVLAIRASQDVDEVVVVHMVKIAPMDKIVYSGSAGSP